MLAQLIPVQGGDPITIVKDVTLVGRQADHCDLVLKRKSVSKIHCVIVKTDGLLFVRDLSSTNGTKVNGQKILRGALLPGDQLSFAGEKFRVHMGPSGANGADTPGRGTEMLDEVGLSEDVPVMAVGDEDVVDADRVLDLEDDDSGISDDDIVE